MKEETKQMKQKIDENGKQYNFGFDATKAKVLAGIQQRLTDIVGTLSEPPTDLDGARLIGKINRLLTYVD